MMQREGRRGAQQTYLNKVWQANHLLLQRVGEQEEGIVNSCSSGYTG